MPATGSNPSLAAMIEGDDIAVAATWPSDYAVSSGTLQAIVKQYRIGSGRWQLMGSSAIVSRNQTVRLRVLAFNAARQGAAFYSSTVTVGLPAPVVVSNPAFSGGVTTIQEGVAIAITPAVYNIEPTSRTWSIALSGGGSVSLGSTPSYTPAGGLAGQTATITETPVFTGVGSPPTPSSAAYSISAAPVSPTVIDLGDGFTATLSAALPFVQHVDGPVRIVSSGPVTITSVTPATTGTGVSLRNGHCLNPVFAGSGVLQGYDGRRAQPSDTMAATFPLTLNPGDILVLSRSTTATLPGLTTEKQRSGYTDAAAMLYVGASAPAAGSVAPASVTWSGRGSPASPSVVDYAAKAALLPTSYGVTGVTYPTLAQVQRALRFNPFYGQRQHTIASDGYESYMPTQWAQITAANSKNWNYGQYVAQGLENFLLALIAPTASVSLAVKAEILMRLDSFATQTRQTTAGRGGAIGTDGAHHQFIQVACALSDWMRGVQPDLSAVLGNWGQAYRITAQHVTDNANGFGSASPLSDGAAYPNSLWFHHLRRVAAVSGNTLTLDTWLNSIGTQGDHQYPRWAPATIIRVSDSASATIISEATGSISSGLQSTKTVTINAQPGTPFAVGDVVRMRTLDNLVAGTADWKERKERVNSGAPVSNQRYQDQVRWGGLMVLRAIGLITPETLTAWDYFVRSNLTNEPASDNYPGSLGTGAIVTGVYAAHIATLQAVSQPYLP